MPTPPPSRRPHLSVVPDVAQDPAPPGEDTPGGDEPSSEERLAAARRHPVLADTLRRGARDLAAEAGRRHHPGSPDRATPASDEVVEAGTAYVRHLAAALSTGRPALFDEYLGWVTHLTSSPGIGSEELSGHLAVLAEVIAERVAAEDAEVVGGLIERSLASLPQSAPESASYLDVHTELGALGSEVLELLLAGDRHGAITRVLEAADGGVGVEDLYLGVFQPCLWEVGRRWQSGRVTVAQEHFVTAAIQLAMAQLYPRVFSTPRVYRTVVVASVGGELHELGGRMVADIFELRGWDAHFVGANVPAGSVADLAAKVEADIVAVSATLPSHLPDVEEVVRAVRARSDARVLVGGRPFNRVPDLWRVVGADGTAVDAVAAVEQAGRLVQEP